jgi:predicted lipid-binding transport protein (Tim44 family)
MSAFFEAEGAYAAARCIFLLETKMKNFALMAAAVVLGMTLNINDAEAKRLGGGNSSGMQRQSVEPSKNTSQAAPAPTAPQAAGAAAQPKRSWMGPVAGLAAGLGLAALASHLGFGEELANMLMIGLLVMVVLMVVGFIMRKKMAAQQPAMAAAGGMQYSGANAGMQQPAGNAYTPAGGSALMPAANAAGGRTGNIPADFDVDAFVRNAKVNFIRLQAANDAGNLDDIREFTSPEMFAEIRMSMAERGDAEQVTDVVQLNAEVLDVAEEANRYIVSVRFHGQIKEEAEAMAEAFDEIWHMTKPRSGGGWVLSGIQQVQ